MVVYVNISGPSPMYCFANVGLLTVGKDFRHLLLACFVVVIMEYRAIPYDYLRQGDCVLCSIGLVICLCV